MKALLIVGWMALMGGLFLGAHHHEESVSLPVFNEKEIRLKSSKGVWLDNGKPFTGILIGFSNFGDTTAISCFKNGLEDGEWRTFYDRNKLQSIRHYSRGRKVGALTKWHENGQLSIKANFVDDEYNGVLQEWDTDGQLLRALTYVNGHEVGQQRAWYPNGKVRSNYTVIDGRRYGLLGTKHCINVSDSISRPL
jgi:antitoxin component YwqK of YwqJK toxin-antitoxin module